MEIASAVQMFVPDAQMGTLESLEGFQRIGVCLPARIVELKLLEVALEGHAAEGQVVQRVLHAIVPVRTTVLLVLAYAPVVQIELSFQTLQDELLLLAASGHLQLEGLAMRSRQHADRNQRHPNHPFASAATIVVALPALPCAPLRQSCPARRRVHSPAAARAPKPVAMPLAWHAAPIAIGAKSRRGGEP